MLCYSSHKIVFIVFMKQEAWEDLLFVVCPRFEQILVCGAFSSLRTLHRPRPKQSLQTRLGPGCEEENAQISWTSFLIRDAFFIPFQWETKLELFETNLVKCLKHHLDRFHRQYKFVNIKQKIRAGAGGSTDSATQSYLRDWIGYKYIYLRPCQPLLCGAIVKQRDRDLRGLRFLQQMPNKDRTNNCIFS